MARDLALFSAAASGSAILLTNLSQALPPKVARLENRQPPGDAVWRKAVTQLAEFRRRKDDDRARALGAAPIAIVVIVAIICVVVAVVSAAERADDVELQQEQKLLTQAIADRGRRVMRELENVAASNDIVLQLHYNF